MNTENKVQKVYAFLRVSNGREIIAAAITPFGAVAMATRDEEALEPMKHLAQTLADETGENLTLAEFTAPHVLETFTPAAMAETESAHAE